VHPQAGNSHKLDRMNELASPEPADNGAETPTGLPASAREIFFRLVPAADSLRSYSLAAFRADLLAGLTVATVAVPQAMAYALIAGLPPQYGLYTAIVMTAVGALFDSSKQLINGPTNAISIALLSALAAVPAGDRISTAIVLALLVGVIQVGITLMRLGDLTRYVSHAVIVGFTAGAGMLLVLDQMKNLLGLPAHGEAGDHFLVRTALTLADLGSLSRWTAAMGIGTIVLVLALRAIKLRIGLAFFPELLATVIIMAGLTAALGLEEKGVLVIGKIPEQLPPFQPPTVEWKMLRDLSSSALAIALLGLLEAIAMAKAIAAQTRQKLDINQQCLSEGLANISGSFFQCFPGSGSLTRSAINQQAGGVSQWSGVMSALAVAVIVLLFAPLARHIPRAALAGILMVTAWSMVDKRQLFYYLRATRFDASVVVATALTAVCISVEFCILIGTLLSFVLYIPRAARLHLLAWTVTPERVLRERTAADPPCGRMLIYSLEGEMFFGSAPDLERQLAAIEEKSREGVRIVVLGMRHVRNPDAVCLTVLDGFLQRLAERKVTVLLCGVRKSLAKVLNRCGLTDRLASPNHVFREEAAFGSSTLDAVRHAYELLGDDLCATCPRRNEKGNGGEPLYYMI
jgi:SulP family sulfate permease